MNSKFIWLTFAVSFILLVPFKIYSTLANLNFENSAIFLVIAGIILLGGIFVVGFSKVTLRNIEIPKSIVLGVLSLVVSGAFFWCIMTYFTDKTQYDWGWQPLLQSFWSVLSFVAFLIFAFTFFQGKNLFKNASFMLFCPVLWVCGTLFLLLSIYNTSADIYDVTSKIMLVLFLLYHTQVFSTSTQGSVTKYTFLFGIPFVIACFMSKIPILVSYFKGTGTYANAPEVVISVAVLEMALALYAFAFMFETRKQMKLEGLEIK